jgi:hypothetical protein
MYVYIYVCVCIYIYTYIHTYIDIVLTETSTSTPQPRVHAQNRYACAYPNQLTWQIHDSVEALDATVAISKQPGAFSPAVKEAKFDAARGSLRITMSTADASSACAVPADASQASSCVMPGVEYTMLFTLMNPARENPAQTLYISSSYYDSDIVLKQSELQPLQNATDDNKVASQDSSSSEKVSATIIVFNCTMPSLYRCNVVSFFAKGMRALTNTAAGTLRSCAHVQRLAHV